ncbi:MAG: glutamate racemase [Christensenellales bacterium]|jgi:glutamate racemase
MTKDMRPIGVFDSGLGGVTMLACAMRELPCEKFIYLADLLHAPYGEKPIEEIRRLVDEALEKLLKHDVKALLVACNTATSVSGQNLKKRLSMPVVCMEPAAKKAVRTAGERPIVVMATPATLSLEKYHLLVDTLKEQGEFVSAACPGLAGMIDADADEAAIRDYLIKTMPEQTRHAGAIVLGCTHYLWIKDQLEALYPGVPLVDGHMGTLRQLRRLLEERNLLASHRASEGERVELLTTGDADALPAMRAKLNRLLENPVWNP